MEISTVANTGYVKIPFEILKNLGLENGGKVSIVKDGDKIIVEKIDKELIENEKERRLNNLIAAYEEKLATEHNVDEFGISDEDREIVRIVKEVREEMWEERYAKSND